MSNIVPIQPYPGHPVRSLKQFAAKADHIVRRYKQLNDQLDVLYEAFVALKDRTQIDQMANEAKRIAMLDDHYKTVLAWCDAAVDRFDPEDNHEIDDDKEFHLKPSVVDGRMALLVGAFPSGAPSDPAVFLKVMIEHVCSVETSLVALDTAIWEAVGTLKFMPAVSEFVVILKQQDALWSKRFEAISEIAEASPWNLREIEATRTKAIKAVEGLEAQQEAGRSRAV
jgi:hypothetical protein